MRTTHSLVDLFQQQVGRHPTRPAIIGGDAPLTFAELNARSNRVAQWLLFTVGVRAEQLVAIVLPRHNDLAVAVLGIWKAGAAYVAVDPLHPPARIAFLLTDSRPAAIIGLAEQRAAIRGAGVPFLAIDDIPADIPAAPPDPNIGDIAPGQLAYMLYTSGSTGRPKGVLIEHGNVANLMAGLEERVFSGVDPVAAMAVNASFSFDPSVQTLFQLCRGRSVAIVPAAVRADPSAMIRFLADYRIAAFDCTPTQLAVLVEAGLFETASAELSVIVVGGEAFPEALWQHAAAAGISIFNAYGPTECTVDTTIAQVTGGRPHLGQPLPGVTVDLVDAMGQVVADGDIGEIRVGGAQVGRGYHERPELTAERFAGIACATERSYLTGDLARMDDGQLIFIGRVDDQLKLRGYRVEPGEISGALSEHPAILAALVMQRDADGDPDALVAYVQTRVRREPRAFARELREFLAVALPDYMLPKYFVALEELPLSLNGKIDRSAFPAPDDSHLAIRPYAPPEGEIEAMVAGFWQALLNVSRVGRDDDFFELGGHSLHAMRLMERLRRAGFRGGIEDLFDAPDLRSFAETVEPIR